MARKKKVTDEQIIEAARLVFVAQGVSASMDVIARELGVTAPVLFTRFGTKLNLFYRAVVPDHVPWLDLAESLRDGPDDRPPEVQIQEIGWRIVLLFDEVMAVVRLCAKNAVSMDEIMGILQIPAVEETIQALARWLEVAHSKRVLVCGDPATVAELIVSALYWQVGYRGYPMESAGGQSLEQACVRTVAALLPTLGLGDPAQGPAVNTPREPRHVWPLVEQPPAARNRRSLS